MLVQILILICGLALIVAGAEFLVNGSASIARKIGISEFVIGLTIVGMGTSAPEMVVSFLGAIEGNADIAIGNVVGSNIFNVFMILGITALIFPMDITRMNLRKDIPINIIVSVLLILLGMNATIFGHGTNSLSRIDGIVLILLFAVYLYLCFHFDTPDSNSDESNEKTYKVFPSILMVAGGLAALIFGGNLFVDSATSIAKMLNVSDKFIAITILAGGTSLPELATCVVAAAKKKGQLALGNIIGSNIFNILLILGGSSLIQPLSFAGMSTVDMGLLLLSACIIALSAFTWKRNQLDRADGVMFLVIELAYMIWLIIE